MARSNDFLFCQQYLINYLEHVKQQIEQYKLKLSQQSTLCPILPVSFDRINRCLKEFVDSEQNYLSKRNQNQLINFKDKLENRALYESICMRYPTSNIPNQLLSIRQKQAEIWEEQLMLEMRILCQFLSPNFDDLERFIYL
jgi:hypothetical protein